MADPRYIQGDTAPHNVTIATAKATSKGNLVGLSSNTLVNASDTAWDTDLATTQAAFVALFLGVSDQSKSSTTNARVYGNSQDNVIRVATGGVWEFDCASATFEVGDLVGPAKQSGNALEDQKVVAAGSESVAIGRVVERGTSVTRVKVKLLSKKLPLARQS
jgi:hypothetical protein